jgi:hypothetical protein
LFNSRSRNHAKITGVTIKMWIKLVAMPPMTGVASGFITSAPIRVLHMIGSKLATIHRTQNVTSDSAEGVDAIVCHRKS